MVYLILLVYPEKLKETSEVFYCCQNKWPPLYNHMNFDLKRCHRNFSEVITFSKQSQKCIHQMVQKVSYLYFQPGMNIQIFCEQCVPLAFSTRPVRCHRSGASAAYRRRVGCGCNCTFVCQRGNGVRHYSAS